MGSNRIASSRRVESTTSTFRCFSSLYLCLLSCLEKSMTAESAFFNDPFCSNRDITIERTPHFFRPLRCIPVKIFYGVRTCGGTVSTADASIIDLCHQSFFVFVSGIDGAHLGARRMIAVHTGSGKKSRLNMRIFSLDI